MNKKFTLRRTLIILLTIIPFAIVTTFVFGLLPAGLIGGLPTEYAWYMLWFVSLLQIINLFTK